MSVSRVVIPVLDLEQNDDPHMKVVVKGAKQISTQIVKASGTANTSEVNFQFQPPSQNTVFDRRIDLHMKVKLQVGLLNLMINYFQQIMVGFLILL